MWRSTRLPSLQCTMPSQAGRVSASWSWCVWARRRRYGRRLVDISNLHYELQCRFKNRIVSLPRWWACTCRALAVMRCCRALLLPSKWAPLKQTLTIPSPFTPPHLRSLSQCVNANTNLHVWLSYMTTSHTGSHYSWSAWWPASFNYVQISIFSYFNYLICAQCFFFLLSFVFVF